LGEALQEEGVLHSSGSHFEAGEAAPLALAYLEAHLREDVVKPHVLLSTRKSDIEAQEERQGRRRAWLLGSMALLGLMVLIFIADLLLSHSLALRERMRVFALEDAEEELFDPELDHLSRQSLLYQTNMLRTRGVLLAVLLIGTLALNLIGILAALYLGSE